MVEVTYGCRPNAWSASAQSEKWRQLLENSLRKFATRPHKRVYYPYTPEFLVNCGARWHGPALPLKEDLYGARSNNRGSGSKGGVCRSQAISSQRNADERSSSSDSDCIEPKDSGREYDAQSAGVGRGAACPANPRRSRRRGDTTFRQQRQLQRL